VEAAKHGWRLKQRACGGINGSRKSHSGLCLWPKCLSPKIWPRPIVEIVGGAALWPGSGSNTALERLLPSLQKEARPVLVLDNIEHLLPAGAALVQTLLQRVPALRILGTSRHPLQIAGESVLEVPLMPVPLPETPPEKLLDWESIQLFQDRARLVRPGFKISRHNAATVARLCERLEGWPLAIEFCAAHANRFAPWQMLQRLEHRLDFLTSAPDNNLPQRHSTLRVMLNWSYELLWPELQRFFAGLSVFRGGGTPEAAAIVTDQPHAAHFLDQLQAASLVRLDADGRFFLLETVREFAREQSSGCEQEELQRRHANYFLDMLNAALPNLQAAASQRRLEQLQKLKIEHDNFRTALEWSLEYNPVMALQLVNATAYFWADLFSEAHSLAEQALEKARHLDSLRGEVMAIAAAEPGRRGDYRRQVNSHDSARPRCENRRRCQIAWGWFHDGSSAFEKLVSTKLPNALSPRCKSSAPVASHAREARQIKLRSPERCLDSQSGRMCAGARRLGAASVLRGSARFFIVSAIEMARLVLSHGATWRDKEGLESSHSTSGTKQSR
jgi:predicted ATPase